MDNTTGTCRYCGSVRIVENASTQADANRIASEECDCDMAARERDKEEQKEIAIANLEFLIKDKFPRAAEALANMIPFIQDFVFTEVTVKLNEVSKLKMTLNDKGSIIITKTDTIKDTVGD